MISWNGSKFVQFECSRLSCLGTRQVPYEEIEFLEKIGKGGQGVVHKGVFGGKIIALKKYLAKEQKKNYSQLDLNYPNLIKFLLVIYIYYFPYKQLQKFL